MKVRFTPRAFSDLDVIRSYIGQFNPAAAGQVVSLIEQSANAWAIFQSQANARMNWTLESRFRHATHIASTIGSPRTAL